MNCKSKGLGRGQCCGLLLAAEGVRRIVDKVELVVGAVQVDSAL